jgi:hypothetical protein
MHSVGKLEKLQNINKTPLFLTWSSDRYGKSVTSQFCLYRMEPSFNDNTIPKGQPS